jgi:hypothetical protein
MRREGEQVEYNGKPLKSEAIITRLHFSTFDLLHR